MHFSTNYLCCEQNGGSTDWEYLSSVSITIPVDVTGSCEFPGLDVQTLMLHLEGKRRVFSEMMSPPWLQFSPHIVVIICQGLMTPRPIRGALQPLVLREAYYLRNSSVPSLFLLSHSPHDRTPTYISVRVYSTPHIRPVCFCVYISYLFPGSLYLLIGRVFRVKLVPRSFFLVGNFTHKRKKKTTPTRLCVYFLWSVDPSRVGAYNASMNWHSTQIAKWNFRLNICRVLSASLAVILPYLGRFQLLTPIVKKLKDFLCARIVTDVEGAPDNRSIFWA